MKPKYVLIYHSGPFKTFEDISAYDTAFKQDGKALTFVEALQHKAQGLEVQFPKSDVRFHFAVDPFASPSILVGRSTEKPGGACKLMGIRKQAIEVCVIGDYNVSNPPRRLLDDLYTLINGIASRWNIPAKRILPGRYFDHEIDSPGLRFNVKRFIKEYFGEADHGKV